MTVARAVTSAFLMVAMAGTSMPAFAAPKLAKASSGQQLQQKLADDVPHCSRKLGTASIADGDDPNVWTQFQLQAPSKLLKVLIQRSGCFNIVERGAGYNAAARERDIGNSLGLQRGSNVGIGQVKAADYVILAELQGANANVSGNAAAGVAGALIGGGIGGLLGGIKSKKLEANTIVSVMNTRTTETLATEDGYAAKNDISFAAGGGFFAGGGAAAIGGGYANTDIGRIITLSFIQAYSKLVTSLGLVGEGAAGTAEAAPKKTYSAMGPVVMRKTAAATGAAIRTLPPGAIVYPTGKQDGLWWEVADENDNVGWVLNTKLAPTR